MVFAACGKGLHVTKTNRICLCVLSCLIWLWGELGMSHRRDQSSFTSSIRRNTLCWRGKWNETISQQKTVDFCVTLAFIAQAWQSKQACMEPLPKNPDVCICKEKANLKHRMESFLSFFLTFLHICVVKVLYAGFEINHVTCNWEKSHTTPPHQLLLICPHHCVKRQKGLDLGLLCHPKHGYIFLHLLTSMDLGCNVTLLRIAL